MHHLLNLFQWNSEADIKKFIYRNTWASEIAFILKPVFWNGIYEDSKLIHIKII